MAVRGVILDVDGTLVDSNDAHAYSWLEVLEEQGVKVPFERVRGLIGRGKERLIAELTGLPPSGERALALAARRGELFRRKYLPRLRPFPGAHRLVEKMHERGLRLVAASAASRDELRPLLAVAGVDALVEGAGPAPRSAPDPDVVVAALARCGCRADEAVLIGDTPGDVAAAARVGVPAIALRCGGWDDRALEGAAAIYDDPDDLLAHFDESPLGSSALH
jgi:phosphoglycolate phosphatase-like HAD superfamily hydrolase